MTLRRFRPIVWITFIVTVLFAKSQDYELVPAFTNLDNVQQVLLYDPPDTYYVSSWDMTDGMRLLRTANSGATWQTLASGLGNTFNFDDGFGPFPNGTYAICRQFRNVVYKQVSDSLHRSEDGGQTWDEIEVSFLNIDTSLDDVASSPIPIWSSFIGGDARRRRVMCSEMSSRMRQTETVGSGTMESVLFGLIPKRATYTLDILPAQKCVVSYA